MMGESNWTELSSDDEIFYGILGGGGDGREMRKKSLMMTGEDNWSDIGYPDVGLTE